jgi:methyl-accepting chemotaxis protein
MNQSSDKIARIIKAVDEIAFQTNILALNVAVGAARAGEAGIGSAAAAEEARNVARCGARAARETAALIEQSIARTQESNRNVGDEAEAGRGTTRQNGAGSGQLAAQAQSLYAKLERLRQLLAAAGVRHQPGADASGTISLATDPHEDRGSTALARLEESLASASVKVPVAVVRG